MKEMSVKKIVTCGIAALTALFTLIALAYPLLSFSATLYGITSKHAESGFNFLSFSTEFSLYSWTPIVVGLLSLLQLLGSIALIVLDVVALFLFKRDLAKKLALATIITCLVFNVLYTIIGIVMAAMMESDYYSTLSYLALIFNALFTVAYFVCLKVLKEDELAGRKTSDGAAPKRSMRQEGDSVELLAKYKKLLDEGAITQEEYDEKKKELL